MRTSDYQICIIRPASSCPHFVWLASKYHSVSTWLTPVRRGFPWWHYWYEYARICLQNFAYPPHVKCNTIWYHLFRIHQIRRTPLKVRLGHREGRGEGRWRAVKSKSKQEWKWLLQIESIYLHLLVVIVNHQRPIFNLLKKR